MQHFWHSTPYAHMAFTFLIESQLHYPLEKYFNAKPFLSLPTKYFCICSPNVKVSWYDIRVYNQIIVLESQSLLTMLRIFSLHILEMPIHKY